ncbi:putative drug exporter of the RND superfamily [Rathayibacter oskolensis]|uniref:Putative drug exporter of the RND superfamily n=1 Tax=Rathayibacter oskolensis TaxID=1891671 RepID=A0A1X7PF39_9MICO|nr:MMPL family transporter [Rathayibacter oskolensis]SMH50026.1 putative drug exporter of the RND superfamily [Rathayibacter oskolensis]
MSPLALLVRTRRGAWITVLAAVLSVGALFALLPSGSEAGFPRSGLPESAPSAEVAALLEEFPSADATAGVVLWNRDSGLTAADTAAIDERARELAALSTTPDAVRPQFSDDGRAALVAVPLSASDVEADVESIADELRATGSADLPTGLDSYLTGAVGFQADVSNAFAGADFRLLLVTVIVVAVLLIATYRSPILWIVPLAVVGVADGLARIVVGALAEAVGLSIDASVSGILSVLVFGAGTNYALLLVARYREELLHEEDRHRAMTTAVRSAGPAIAASGGTVALSLLTLLLAELAGNRALGFACAVGVVIAIVFALVVLPSALVLCGRGLFWPFVPRPRGADAVPRKDGLWTRLGRGVARRPGRVAIVATVGVALLSLGLVGASVGLSQTEQLLGDPESVRAQVVIDESFGAGLTAQTTVLTPDDAVADAVVLAEGTSGVETVRPGESANGLTSLSLVLASEPESAESFATITALRAAYAEATGPVAQSLVGGSDATALDTRSASERDQGLIIPIILAIVFVILALLLRSLVAPVLLIASVLATFFASLGAANLIFRGLLGFPAFDANVVLFAFLFLVALGVDYNIFLVTRAREERALHGTREGMVRALASTGGVITSAGVLLAAVFAVLGVLPVVALTQIGVIVCIGVLLDTLVVRTVLVPALVFLTGDVFWWPSSRRTARHTASA